MKPIIIIKEKNTNGKFELTEKELKGLINQAYEQGVEDAKAQSQPSIQNIPPEWYDGKKDITPNYPRNIYGDPVPYCGNDLVYRCWEHNVKFPKQGEPIPCWLNQTSSQSNPNITAWNNTTSKQPNEDSYTLT